MFEVVTKGPVDSFFHLKKKADRDAHPDKVDVGVGIYRNEQGRYQELDVVRQAKRILADLDLGHDYGLTIGDEKFLRLAADVNFGQDSALLALGKALSGTGANHLAALLLSRSLNSKPKVYVALPNWGNTEPLFQFAGLETVQYNYEDPQNNKVDFESCLKAVRGAPSGSVFFLQGCCYNPTGHDLSAEQWRALGEEMRAKGHVPLIDIAYQGLGDGLDEDAAGIRILAGLSIDMIVCQSFSKNFALYGERCGVIHVVTQTPTIAATVQDQLRSLIRREFSSSPAFGSRIVTIILEDPELRERWKQELSEMRTRLRKNRAVLVDQLTNVLKTPGDWTHITRATGLFTILDLTPAQCNKLIDEYHVHLPANGRINVAGLSTENIERTAHAINAVCRTDL